MWWKLYVNDAALCYCDKILKAHDFVSLRILKKHASLFVWKQRFSFRKIYQHAVLKRYLK